MKPVLVALRKFILSKLCFFGIKKMDWFLVVFTIMVPYTTWNQKPSGGGFIPSKRSQIKTGPISCEKQVTDE